MCLMTLREMRLHANLSVHFQESGIIRELEQIIEIKARQPQRIVLDNGPDFTSRAFLGWASIEKWDFESSCILTSTKVTIKN